VPSDRFSREAEVSRSFSRAAGGRPPLLKDPRLQQPIGHNRRQGSAIPREDGGQNQKGEGDDYSGTADSGDCRANTVLSTMTRHDHSSTGKMPTAIVSAKLQLPRSTAQRDIRL
jgi:hypothetical protein